MRRAVREALAGLLLLGAAAAAAAQESSDLAQRLRPTGPVTITARNADWVKGGTMVYTGEVKLSSDTLELDGDRLELKQLAAGQFEARVSGGPANLRHAGETGADGKVEPPVTARARTLTYDSRSGIIEVAGDARLTRGTDEITGQTIRYNVPERRIQADGGSGGQVRIVIQPPPEDDEKPAAPAPAP